MSKKSFDERFSLEVLHYPGSDTMNKIAEFSSQYSYTSVKFWTEFLIGEFELVVAEEYKFEN